MKVLALSAALVAAGISVNAQAVETYTIDSSHTYPNFEVDHLGFSTTHGRFNKTEGKLTIDWANNSGSVDITIDAASVDTGHQKRDDHLRNADFLNVVEFPQITYKSSNVTIKDNKSATVEGQLTIMGISKPVTLDVESINCGPHPMKKGTHVCGFDATGSFKRSDFDVKYALPAVGDELKLKIQVEAHRD